MDEVEVEETPSENISKVKLYPNPAFDQVNLEIASLNEQATTFMVFDVNGQMVQQFTKQIEAGTQTQVLSVDQLNAGVYYVNIIQGEQRIVKKFIVIR